MAAHTLDLETLIPSVSTMMLEVHRHQQHYKDLPGSLQHEDELLHHHTQSPPLPTPTTEGMEAQDLPGSLQHKDTHLLHHNSQSPLLPTPTTEDMEAQVIVKPILDAKLDNDKSLVNETSHLTKIHITPKQSANLPGNLNDTKPKDSTAHDTANKHSCTDNVNHKSSPVKDNENKEPRNTVAHQHNSAFDTPKITSIIDKLPGTTPDNSSGNKLLTNYPFRGPSKSVDVLIESAPNDDLNSKDTHEKEPHTSFTSDLHEVKDKEPSPFLAKEQPPTANNDDSSMNPDKPKHTDSSIIELTGLEEEEPAEDLENTDPDESSLDNLKHAKYCQIQLTDLKEEESAANKENSDPVESSTQSPAPNTKNSLEDLDKQKHDKPGNLTEDDPPDETETPHPNEAKESEHNPMKSVDPPDKDDESPSNPPETNKSEVCTDPLNGNEEPTQNPPDKPEPCGENGDNPLNPLKTSKSAAPTDTLIEDKTPPQNPRDYPEFNEEKNDDPSETNEESPTSPETDDLAAPD